MKELKIAIFGLGYVGLSNAVLLSKKHRVVAIDINQERVRLVNKRVSPIRDKEIEESFASENLKLTASVDPKSFYGSDLVIVATPTNYDEETGYFDTKSVESVIEFINSFPSYQQRLHEKEKDLQGGSASGGGVNYFSTKLPLIVIKSTIPIGFVEKLKERGHNNVIFVPEFLREGSALHDNLFPSRIVIGEKSERAKKLAYILADAAIEQNIPIIYTGPSEAESIKLFSNTYLAMRVAYVNEIDTFAAVNGLDSKDILDGMTLDPRIGTHYRNPSFGYGGYCLPKDTKQLLANYQKKNVPEKLIQAIVDSNSCRLDWIASSVINSEVKTVGIYRLIMKSGSDNFRASAALQLINRLKKIKGLKIVIFEPTISEAEFDGCEVVEDLLIFKQKSQLIFANRFNDCLADVQEKVITRDVYHQN